MEQKSDIGRGWRSGGNQGNPTLSKRSGPGGGQRTVRGESGSGRAESGPGPSGGLGFLLEEAISTFSISQSHTLEGPMMFLEDEWIAYSVAGE